LESDEEDDGSVGSHGGSTHSGAHNMGRRGGGRKQLTKVVLGAAAVLAAVVTLVQLFSLAFGSGVNMGVGSGHRRGVKRGSSSSGGSGSGSGGGITVRKHGMELEDDGFAAPRRLASDALLVWGDQSTAAAAKAKAKAKAAKAAKATSRKKKKSGKEEEEDDDQGDRLLHSLEEPSGGSWEGNPTVGGSVVLLLTSRVTLLVTSFVYSIVLFELETK
jgi:hypothetical protein